MNEQGCSAVEFGHFETVAENAVESADICDVRLISRLIWLTESPRDNRFMKAEMKATIGEFFDVRVGEADAAAALPASSEACSLVVVCAASEAPGVTGSPRQALKVRTSTPRIFTGTDLIGTMVAEGR